MRIKLENGFDVEVPGNFAYCRCDKCGMSNLIWGKTVKNHKFVLVRILDNNKWISHFDECEGLKA